MSVDEEFEWYEYLTIFSCLLDVFASSVKGSEYLCLLNLMQALIFIIIELLDLTQYPFVAKQACPQW